VTAPNNAIGTGLMDLTAVLAFKNAHDKHQAVAIPDPFSESPALIT
jgi:hypothetical protein